MSLTKRQHYVWRHYLRAWAQEEKIWTYLKEFNSIKRINLMGVAQEKFLYRLVDFTHAEEKFLSDFIDRSSHKLTKGLNFDFLALFTSTGKLKASLDKTINTDVDKTKYAEEIRKLEINLMEEGHGRMEALGNRLLTYRSIEDLKTIEENDYIFDAITFLCFQYFRTKNMRNSALKSFIGGPYEELARKSWNIISYVMATNLARNVSLNKDLKFVFINNDTDTHFITGDQPVFNIKNDQINEQGEVTGLEFYYPITPRHAISIHFHDDQTEKFKEQNANPVKVQYLNGKVLDNSEFFVFADTKDQLDKLIP